MDITEFKRIKKLGAGMFGTTYLVSDKNGNKYAMKIQKILEENRKPDFKNEFHRELDLYKYINKLPVSQQKFFTKLYHYEITDKIKHDQSKERPFQPGKDNKEFIETLKKLDESKYYLVYITDYQSPTILRDLLVKIGESNKKKPELIYNLCLQLCNILEILRSGGYIHGDLHPGNLIISKLDKLEKLRFLDKQFSYSNYRLIAIDYGSVRHKKFGKEYHLSDIQFFDEIFLWISIILFNDDHMFFQCKKKNKKMPFQLGKDHPGLLMNHIIKNHNDFYRVTKTKYFRLFPKKAKMTEPVFDKIESAAKKSSETMREMLKKLKPKSEIRRAVETLIDLFIAEFSIYFPKEFVKIFDFCSQPSTSVPESDILEFLECNTIEKIYQFIIDKYQKYKK